MLKKIKDGWYVMIHKIDHVTYDETSELYSYSIEGQQYSYQVNKEEGKLLLDALDEFISIITDTRLKQIEAIEKINNARERLSGEQPTV